jgi:hypothetical protein
LVNNKIDVDGLNLDISSNVKNDATLIRTGSGEIWTKIKQLFCIGMHNSTNPDSFGDNQLKAASFRGGGST